MESMSPGTDRVIRFTVGAVLSVSMLGLVQAQQRVERACDADPRCQAIRNLFLRYKSPLEGLALVFVQAADSNGLDWRLLPAISIVETTGGRYGTPGNIFGWNSGRTSFRTVEDGIHFVAGRFARSPIYAGKKALAILERYNPARKAYPPKVTRVMLELAGHAVE